MRPPRLLAPQSIAHPVYHCLSRVVDRRMIFQKAEKEQFVKFMRLYEKLCGVRILTYCVMGNHFHILVEVPRRPATLPTEAELIKLVTETLGESRGKSLAGQFERWRAQHNEGAIVQEMERWFAQMWDLGRFMKMVKQRFSQWYNLKQPGPRTGTLWEGRYRSVLVECGHALHSMAMYIDLNPVRAQIVADPKDYRWCGYGEAVAGQSLARASLGRMATLASPALANRTSDQDTWLKGVIEWYREALFGRGAEVRDETGAVIRAGFTRSEIDAVIKAGGSLPLAIYLRLRVRYLTEGVVLGSQEFVEDIVRQYSNRFSRRRHTSPKRLQGLDHGCPLRTVRG